MTERKKWRVFKPMIDIVDPRDIKCDLQLETNGYYWIEHRNLGWMIGQYNKLRNLFTAWGTDFHLCDFKEIDYNQILRNTE